jgi:hypothetical protein
MICGYPAEQGVAAAPAAKPMAPPIPLRPAQDGSEPSLRDAIVESYHVYGLVQTGHDFGIKPSTLVLRLKKWGVDLHGRGWKPSHVREKRGGGVATVSGAEGIAQDAQRLILDSLAGPMDELERAVAASAQACGGGAAARGYHAGRMEMLQIVRLMLRQARPR